MLIVSTFRQRVRYEKFYKRMSRQEYIDFCKSLGLYDICECEPFNLVTTHRRPNSGINGILECTECLYIVHPLMYMYACDECTEPALADQSYLPVDVKFYCEDCP
jgi:hypothetical protein